MVDTKAACERGRVLRVELVGEPPEAIRRVEELTIQLNRRGAGTLRGPSF